MSRLKAIYEELHPETKNGAHGGKGGKKNENDTVSFSIDTANKTGKTERTIQRYNKIGSTLSGYQHTYNISKQDKATHVEFGKLVKKEPGKTWDSRTQDNNTYNISNNLDQVSKNGGTSKAFAYRQLEKHAPELLEEVKQD